MTCPGTAACWWEALLQYFQCSRPSNQVAVSIPLVVKALEPILAIELFPRDHADSAAQFKATLCQAFF